jgi:hypothetical protein
MFVLNLELAFSCPPLGLNLFISSFRFNRPVISLYRVAMPFVGILAFALLLVTYIPPISNYRVLEDIQRWREQAEKEGRVPSEAWFLECVQLDRNNPKPCSEEDKKKYPNGQMPEPATPDKDAGTGAEPTGEDEEDLDAIIKGAGGDSGTKAPGQECEDDILAAIKGGSDDADAGADAVAKPKPKTGQESEEDLMDLIKGN